MSHDLPCEESLAGKFFFGIYKYQTGVAKDNALGRVKKWGVRKKTSRVNGLLQCTWGLI
jgi:hypothetical protein